MRAACVVNAATAVDPPTQLVARRLVSSVVGSVAETSVLRALPAAGPSWEIGLRSKDFEASAPSPARARALRALLRPAARGGPACQCATRQVSESAVIETAYVEAAGGVAPALVEHLRQQQYDLIVFLGLLSWPTLEGLTVASPASRVVIAPLLTDVRLARLPRARSALGCADAIVALSPDESFECGLDGSAVLDVALRVHERGGTPRGLPDGAYALLLGDWDDPVTGPSWRREAGRIARLTRMTTIVLADGFIWPNRWPDDVLVRSGGSRADVWRWMRHALAVVDLSPHPTFPRNTIESMLCGTPVLVPAGSVADRNLEASGGVLSFRNSADVVVALRRLADRRVRDPLAQAGQTYAAARFGDVSRYTSRVVELVCGRPPTTDK